MKQTIIDLLQTKFDGVDESILSRIAETKAAKAIKTEDEANTFVEGVTLNQLLSSYADIRSTEAQRTAVANYEKKHGLKDGKKVSEGNLKTLDTDDNDDMPAWAQALIDSNKTLANEVSTLKADKTRTSRKQRLDEIINQLPERDRRGYARTSYDSLSDEDFDALLKDISGEVTEFLKEEKTNGSAFRAPFQRRQGSHSSEKEASKAEVEAVVDGLI